MHLDLLICLSNRKVFGKCDLASSGHAFFTLIDLVRPFSVRKERLEGNHHCKWQCCVLDDLVNQTHRRGKPTELTRMVALCKSGGEDQGGDAVAEAVVAFKD